MNCAKTVHSGFNGIYDIPLAARYLQASKSLLEDDDCGHRRQFSGRIQPLLQKWIRTGLALPTLAEKTEQPILLTFEDLISLRVVFALRSAGFSLQKIRRAENNLRGFTGQERPFATQVVLQNLGQPSEIFTVFGGALMSATNAGQLLFDFFRHELKIVIRQLHFADDGMANLWRAYHGIALNPEIQFGASCIEGTRIPTASIYSMVQGGDSESFLARSYGVRLEQIADAVAWEKEVRAAA